MKVISQNKNNHFTEEIEILKKIDNIHLIKLIDFFTINNHPDSYFIVTEYYEVSYPKILEKI